MKTILLSLVLSTTPLFLIGQNTHYFNKILSNDTTIMLSTCVLPIDSGYLVTGIYNPTPILPEGQYTKKIFLQRLDSLGNEIGFHYLDSENSEEERQLTSPERGNLFIECSDGNFLLAYESGKDVSLTDLDIQYVKFNVNGEILWKKSITGETKQVVKSVIETSDNGFLLVGFNNIEPIITSHFYAVKTDSLGEIEWEITQPMGTLHSSAFSCVEDADGGFVLSGYAAHPDTYFDIQLLKLDIDGNYVWEKNYDVNGWTECAGFLVPSANGYLISTCTVDPIGNFDDLKHHYILKLDENFDMEWDYLYPTAEEWFAFGSDPVVNTDGSFVQAGRFKTINPIPFIRKFSPTGEIEWTWSDTNDENNAVLSRDLEKTKDGGYVMAAFQFTGWQRGWLVKIDSMGNSCSYVGCDSTVYALPEDTLVEDTTDTIIDGLYFTNLASIQAYPNPATTSVTFSYQIEKQETIFLYNALGQLIQEIPLSPSSDSQKISTESFTEGIYYWQLSNQNGKLIISR